MPRAKAVLQSEFPYHVTARCINAEWFHIPMDQVWEIFCSELKACCEDHRLQIHCFVLMTNHFHLIVSTPEANISSAMQQFMYRTSRRLTRAGNRINETFAGRHYKTILTTNEYFANTYKYIYRNPIAAGICESVEHYRYSTIYFLVSGREPPFPIVKDPRVLKHSRETLRWLNKPIESEKAKAVSCALKHQYFKYRKAGPNRQPLIQEHELV